MYTLLNSYNALYTYRQHSISETQVMEQRILSFSIKEQLLVMLQNVNDVEQKSAPTFQRRLAYV